MAVWNWLARFYERFSDRIWGLAVIFMAAFLIAMMTGPAAAEGYWAWTMHSGGNGYFQEAIRSSQYRYNKRRRVVYKRRRKTYARVKPKTDRYCLNSVRAVGSQWIGERGAKSSAIKAWRETIRFDSGEKYSDWSNAKHIIYGCSRSSIGEVAGKVLYRCEVRATPCRMKLVSEGR